MTAFNNDNRFMSMAEELNNQGLDGLGKAVALLINEAMLIEQERYLNA